MKRLTILLMVVFAVVLMISTTSSRYAKNEKARVSIEFTGTIAPTATAATPGASPTIDPSATPVNSLPPEPITEETGLPDATAAGSQSEPTATPEPTPTPTIEPTAEPTPSPAPEQTAPTKQTAPPETSGSDTGEATATPTPAPE